MLHLSVPRRRRFSGLLLLTCLGLAAACGTTVPVSQQAAVGGASTGLGTGGDAGATSGLSPAGTTGGAASTSGSGGATSGTSSTGGASSTTSGGATSGSSATSGTGALPPVPTGAVATTGHGWDAKHVYIGVLTQKDFQKTFATAGYSGIDPGDTEAQSRAVVDDINAHGGILGRQVVIRYDDVPTLASAQNPDSAAQQVCSYYAQDHPVVALFSIVHTIDTGNFRACLAKARIPYFDASLSVLGQSASQRLSPYFYGVGTPSWDVLAPVLVRELAAQGYFTGWNARTAKPMTGVAPVLGVLTADDAQGLADEKLIVGSLKAAGYTKVFTYNYAPPGSEIDGAVLKFAQSGVTHVISDDIELVTFQIHAQSQSYIPRYAIHTYNAPSTNLEGVGPAGQQVGDVGVGWAPTFDVGTANDPGVFSSAERSCRALMAKNHVTSSDRLAEAFAMLMCDSLRLAAGAMSKGFSPQSLYAEAMRLGPSFTSAFTFSSGLSPKRLFLPAAVRHLGWNTACKCFRYLGSATTRM